MTVKLIGDRVVINDVINMDLASAIAMAEEILKAVEPVIADNWLEAMLQRGAIVDVVDDDFDAVV